MLAAIGLFACKNDDGDEPGPGPGPGPVLNDDDIQNITRVSGANDLVFTDADTWDDVLGSLQEKITVRVRTKKGETIDLEGSDCTFSSAIAVDEYSHFEIGAYKISVKPTENNPTNLARELDVEITHDFQAGEAGAPDICSYEHCRATRISSAEDTIIHYGAFHSGTNNTVPAKVFGEDGTAGKVYTNKSTEKSYIEEFGTVLTDTNGVKENLTIPTLTVGKLEPGMTITVKGKAQTAWGKWGIAEDAYYYFPVIGIADRYNNTPVWQGTAASGYTGGTSVFVRGEGWVLYNGIDSTATGKNRPLSALSLQSYGQIGNGKGEARNYGSHENAELGTNEKRPDSFTPGQIPAVSDWVDWVVYSTGNISQSPAYNDEIGITLTWNYRQDGIIEMSYDVNGSVLKAMVKVPAASMGYYDTMLHGDYVDMKITSYERIETRTPTSFTIDNVAEKSYYEGEAFDPSTITANFTYSQSGTEKFPQGLALANVYATADTIDVNAWNANNGKDDNANWVSLVENPAVLSTYKYFKVQVDKGGETWRAYFAAEGKVNITQNVIESVTEGLSDGIIPNLLGTLALGADGGKVTVKPSGVAYVQTIPTGAEWQNGTPSAAARLVLMQINARNGENLGAITEAKSGETNVPYLVFNEGDMYLLALAITPETKVVTVKGLQTTDTVFDFSEARGFNVNETITVPDDTGNWSFNNNANQVTVTFTPNEGKTIGMINVGGITWYAPSEMIDDLKTGDYEQDGITVKKEGSSWESGTLTIVAEFPAANLANYAQREISIFVDGDYEFVFKIDYVADFVETNNFDEGWYSFVSDGKIYLAQNATADGGSLKLNLNEGNENVNVLDLGYTFANGVAAFKNAAPEGASIAVLNIAGGEIVLIEIDPTKYDIEGNYGYQLNASAKFFAVKDGVAALKEITGGSSILLNEGSCLEKGLKGTRVTLDGVAFVANPTEFAGTHHAVLDPNTATKCTLCGQTVERGRINPNSVFTLHDNEFVELSEVYWTVTKKADNNWALWNGVLLDLTIDGTLYHVCPDGYISDSTYAPVENADIVVSTLDESGARTPNGKIDGDGEGITEESFMTEINNKAIFRIWAGYQDNTFTYTYRLYKAKDAAVGTKYDTVYFEFTHTFKNVTANELTLDFKLDNCKIANSGSNGVWSVSGKIDKSAISEVTTKEDNISFAIGNIEDHFAVVSATGGNAFAISNDAIDHRVSEGALTQEQADMLKAGGYNKVIDADISFNATLGLDNWTATVYADKEFTQPVATAFALPEGGREEGLYVSVYLKADETPGVYYIDLTNSLGSTLQNDIKLDFTAVSMYDTKAEVTNNAKIVSGGTVTVEYTGLPADTAGMKFAVNGVEAELAASMTFEGTGVTAAWNGSALTLTLAPNVNLAGVPEYTVSLIAANGGVVTTSRFSVTALPAAGGNIFEKENGKIYGAAEGNKLYLYLVGDVATGTEFLEFSANNAKTISDAAEKLLPYNLAYSLSGQLVAFTTTNDFTNSVTASHFESGSFKITQFAIDLSYLEIEETAQYYFYLLGAKTEAAESYYTVVTNRTVTPTTDPNKGDKIAAVQNSCTQMGSEGYAIKDGETTVGYYGLKALPSHTWVQHATDATMFECSVCHAWLASGSAKGKAIPAIEQIGEEGSKQSIVDTGLTVSFEVSASIIASPDDWGANALVPTGSGIILTLPNIDPWNNTVASMAQASTRDKELAAKFKGGKSFPGGEDLKNGAAWNVFNGTSYLTFVISKANGIQYFRNGVLVIHYSAERVIKDGTGAEYAELILSLAEKVGLTIGSGVTSAKDVLIQRGTLTEAEVLARYQLYTQEKNILPTAHEHSYDPTTHLCTVCGALDARYDFPTYTTETSFTLGTDGTVEGGGWVGYTPTTGKYFAVQKGKKITISGTMKSQASNNWSTPLISVFSGKAMVSGIFRGDNYIIEGDNLKANEGWAIAQTHTHSANDDTWTAFRGIIADCSVTIEIDWTNASSIVVKETFTKTGATDSATQTYTITPASGKQFLDQYSAELGLESCYLNITSVTQTEA